VLRSARPTVSRSSAFPSDGDRIDLLCAHRSSLYSAAAPAEAGTLNACPAAPGLLEERRLSRDLFELPKVAQANADKTKALLRAHAHSLSERQGDIG
jgi:hypothetical protein